MTDFDSARMQAVLDYVQKGTLPALSALRNQLSDPQFARFNYTLALLGPDEMERRLFAEVDKMRDALLAGNSMYMRSAPLARFLGEARMARQTFQHDEFVCVCNPHILEEIYTSMGLGDGCTT